MANKKASPIAAALGRDRDQGAPGATAIPTDPIRVTVDLDRGVHAEANAWMGQRYQAAGGKVEMSAVVRALLAELLSETDEGRQLADRVTDRIRDQLAERRRLQRRAR